MDVLASIWGGLKWIPSKIASAICSKLSSDIAAKVVAESRSLQGQPVEHTCTCVFNAEPIAPGGTWMSAGAVGYTPLVQYWMTGEKTIKLVCYWFDKGTCTSPHPAKRDKCHVFHGYN
jgi:hypothetical protein